MSTDPAEVLVRRLDAYLAAPSAGAAVHVLEHVREAFELCAAHDLLEFADGASQAEVAEVLEISQQAVSKRLAAARRRLEKPSQPFTFAERGPDGSILIRRHGGGS